ncbi:MAG TPA: hypothetical protein DD400_03210 [Rhodospirillaceae bacterium]|nr:hypothetical protein [Rhodospirillaceae bacterium]
MLPFASNPTAQAKLVNQTKRLHLLVSFETSSPPVLWYYDLKKTPSMNLCLKEKEGEWDLGLNLPDEKFSVIAHFDERGDAEKAFAAVRKALLKRQLFSAIGPWTRAGLFLLLLFFALMLFNPQTGTNPSIKDKAIPVAPKSTEIIPGVPMNADDVMRPPAD